MQGFDALGFLAVGGFVVARWSAFAQEGKDGLGDFDHRRRIFIAALGFFGVGVDAFFERFEIGDGEFELDDFGIAQGVDAAFDMGNIAVLEAAQHIHHGIHFADMGEEFVAEAFALARAAHEARDIDKFKLVGDDHRRFGDFGELGLARVRHRNAADIRLDGAERIVRRFRRLLGEQRVEEGRFADVRQADDATIKAHR